MNNSKKFHDDPDQFVVPHLLRELKPDCTCAVCEVLRESIEDGFSDSPSSVSVSLAKVYERVQAILRERANDLTKEACDECEQCGPVVMCSYHSILSELAGHVQLPAPGIAEKEHHPDCPALPANHDRYTMNNFPFRECRCDVYRRAAAPGIATPSEKEREHEKRLATIRGLLDAGEYHNREDFGAGGIQTAEGAIEYLLAAQGIATPDVIADVVKDMRKLAERDLLVYRGTLTKWADRLEGK